MFEGFLGTDSTVRERESECHLLSSWSGKRTLHACHAVVRRYPRDRHSGLVFFRVESVHVVGMSFHVVAASMSLVTPKGDVGFPKRVRSGVEQVGVVLHPEQQLTH